MSAADTTKSNSPAQRPQSHLRWILAAFGCFGIGFLGIVLSSPTLGGIGIGGFVTCIIASIVTGFVVHTRWRRQMSAHNYDWYRTEHPDLVTRDGSVKCATCGGARVHVRGLMQKTFMREHFCTQCGATLYYSPEAQ